MTDRPYDPYIPSGQSPGAHDDGDPRTTRIQHQIDQTIDVMRDNVRRAGERGARLDDLQGKTDHLADSAQQFRRGANQVRKKMWWKDMKMRIWLTIGIIVLLAIIIIPAVVATRN